MLAQSGTPTTIANMSTTEKIRLATPMRRGAEMHEIAALVAFLASDEALFITGSDFVIDGGLLAAGAMGEVSYDFGS